jgi:hypothetical protein
MYINDLRSIMAGCFWDFCKLVIPSAVTKNTILFVLLVNMQFFKPQLFKPLVRTSIQTIGVSFKPKLIRHITDPPEFPRPRYDTIIKNPEFLTPRTALTLDFDRYPWWAVPKPNKPKEIQGKDVPLQH